MERSAQGEGEHAQYNLGIIYRDGKGVQQNKTTSVAWFKKAADNGFQEAKAELAIALAQGEGIEMNLLKAYELAKEVELSGIERGSKIKEFIESKMTDKELLEARK